MKSRSSPDVELKGSSLSGMLREDTIALGVAVGGWQEAVRAAGELLVRSGAVEPRYVPAMIDMVKEIGPYIVIAPGVAIPHARPEDGVLRSCMSLLTLEPPVSFGNEHNDPVTLVVSFGAPESEKHLEALRDLARLLEDAERLAKIKSAASVQDVLDAVAGASV